jgi:uncharacterized protein (DUF2147 family)
MSRTLEPSYLTKSFQPRVASGPWVRAIAVGIVAAIAMPDDGSAAGQPSQAVGLWYDDTGKGAVEILPCGQALCGRIVWLREPLSNAGKPLTDRHNPEPAKRGRPICGLQVLGGLQPQEDGTWDAGWVYDPKEGKSYDAAVQVEGPSRLAVTGYLGVKFLGRTLSWTKAPPDLPRCAT